MSNITLNGIPTWLRFTVSTLWLLAMGVAIMLAFTPLEYLTWLGRVLTPLAHHIQLERAVYSPLAYLTLFSLVAWCEIRMPAREQPLLTPSLVLDTTYYLTNMLAQAFFIGVWIVLVSSFYDRHLDFLTIWAVTDWHPAAKLLTAILVADFAKWVSHYLRHRIHWLWVFHAVHHSQRHMNVFTVNRNHPNDLLLSRTFNVIPLLMFQNTGSIILGWLILETMYSKFYHANLRINFGPLGWIFVTPQSHRLHHSAVAAQHDLNFGFTFSIWDRLFGTQYDNPDDFVETGIEDPDFPHEQSFSPWHLVVCWWQQFLYPFRALLRPNRQGSTP